MKKNGLFEKGRAFEKRTGFFIYKKVSVVSQIIGKMSARATLNNLEPKINVLGDAVEEIRSCLIAFDARATETGVIQDKVEDRLIVLEDKVERIHDYLNAVVDRINDLHKWVDTFRDKDLCSHEEMGTSDEEEEFEFDDYDDKIDEQVARIKNDNTQ